MSKQTTYKFLEPVSVGGRTYGEVTLRRAKGRDMLAISKAAKDDEIEAGFLAISLLTEVPRDVIDEMDADDVSALTEIIGDFLPKPKAETPTQ